MFPLPSKKQKEMINNDNKTTLLIQYFVSLDIESIPVFSKNYDLLDNIYKEINSNFQQIILNENCQYNLTYLIKKSNFIQLNEILQNIRDPIFCIKKKLGSKIYEKILNEIFSAEVKINEMKKIIKSFYKQFFQDKKKLKELILNNVSTFPIRLYLKILKDIFEKYENVSIKEDLLDVDFLNELLAENKDLENVGCLFTLLNFLQLFDENIQQKFYKNFIKKLKNNPAIIEDKSYSYFYETIIKVSDQKNLDLFYETIGSNLLHFIKHERSNYVISGIAKRNPNISDKLYEFLIANNINKNSNIYISLLISSIKSQNENLRKKIFKEILPENFIDLFINEGTINKKYLEVFCLLISSGIDLKVNLVEEFKKRFQFFWMETEKGVKLCVVMVKIYPEIASFLCSQMKERKIKTNSFSDELLKELKKTALQYFLKRNKDHKK
ncbi:hypothetical protein CDIK_3085 [Cucumispora dikerogammari]|nr:hypothetical protein CDIK_3085 [Cucumispora dikerogammari]